MFSDTGWDLSHYKKEFKSRVIKVSDFNPDSSFKDIYLDDDTLWYQYPSEFIAARNLDKIVDPPAGTLSYIEDESFTGIQSCVEWLRNDNKCTLYIDYVELYDNNGWNRYLANPDEVADTIKAYVSSFKNSGWSNIKYWGGIDEPYTIDAYMPIRVVDSLIRLVNPDAPLMISFNPAWSWDHKINGEDEMLQFHNWTYLDKYWFNYLPINLIRQKFLRLETLR